MGSPILFGGGGKSKSLQSGVVFNTGAALLSGTVNPSAVATDAVKGSFYTNVTSGVVYKKQDNGSTTNWTEFSGSSAINFNANPNASTDLTGVNAYADAAGVLPVDGTGGSPASTIVRNTTSPIYGATDFLWTKSAANRQGEGFSIDLPAIPEAYLGQSISINFLQKTSASFVTGDVRVFVFDVTNNLLIEPTANQIQAVGLASPAQTMRFQTATNSNLYRLVFHTATTSALAYTIEFANIILSPRAVTAGFAATDWVSYVPQINGVGTPSTNEAEWRRVGDTIFVRGWYTTGTPAHVFLYLGLPAGLSLDTTAMTTQSRILGFITKAIGGATSLAGTGSGPYAITNENTTPAGVLASYETNASNNHFPAAYADYIGSAGQTFSYEYSAKILGWSSNIPAADLSSMRAVAFAANTANNSSSNAGPAYIFTNVTVDTHGCYDPATGKYTVKIPANYLVMSTVYIGAGSDAMAIHINGTYTTQGICNDPNNSPGHVFDVYPLKSGDTIEIRTTGSSSAAQGGAGLTRFSVAMVGSAAFDNTVVSSGLTRTIVPISSNTTLGSTAKTDYIATVTGTTTVTLPTAAGNTNQYVIKNAGVATVTVATTSAQTIDGTTTASLSPNTAITVISNGANWSVIA